MAKVWKEHPLFGRELTYQDGANEFKVRVVNVKAGPMMIDTSKLDQPEAPIIGTIKLQLKPLDGHRAPFWSAPLEYKDPA